MPAENFDHYPSARAAELQQGMDDFKDWEQWSARWTNRRQPGWLTTYRDRPTKPSPPAWLAGECEAITTDDPLITACALLADWTEDPATAQVRLTQVTTSTQKEAESKSMWWEHVHLDLLWPATQIHNTVYGVVGSHVAMDVAGRLEVFVAPGVMFLNLPTRTGTRAWRVATNYGIGYRLFSFRFRDHVASVHANMAKAWLLSDPEDLVTHRSLDFAGLSLTFSKPR
jgi:hypothetical protein